ncbi:MAG: 23S rRNA (pseudouridine(1915)-N(3))-methyltransferase RlmH [Luteolibacter sp.]
MKIQIIAAGRPALAYAKLGVDEYLKRLGRYGAYSIEVVKSGTREEVSARLLERSRGSFRIALDERGEMLSTRIFAERLDALALRGEIKLLSFLIGGSDGHGVELRESCEMVLSLSPLTMQHELALVVLLEQLYRVETLRSGSPYHRD